MKKFALKATVGAAAVLVAGFAQAGILSAEQATYDDAAAALAVTNYAREALLPATAVQTPGVAVQFTGFEVTAGVPYRVVLEVANGEFTGAQPAPDDLLLDNGTPATDISCVAVTFSGQTASQLAWECTSVADDKIGISFDPGTLNVKAANLASGGAAVTIKAELQSREGFAIYDKVAATEFMKGVQAIKVTADTDTGNTKADVNAATPLYKFVVGGAAPADTADAAVARFAVSNNNPAAGIAQAVCPDDVTTRFDMNANCGAYVPTGALKLKLTDTTMEYAALASLKAATSVGLDETFTVAGANATLNITPTAGEFGAAGNDTDVDVTYTASGTASLGTERTIGLLADIDGGGQTFQASNNNWWVWGNNGTVLKFPALSYGKEDKAWVSVQNAGGNKATFTTQCLSENGILEGLAGEVGAGKTAKFGSLALCKNDKSQTRSVIMTFAAPSGSINGTVVRVNNTTGAHTYVNASRGNQ